MKMNPEEITAIIKEQIKNYEVDLEIDEVGTVIEIGDGIAHIHGLQKAMAGELLDFGNDIFGLVLNLEQDNVGAVVLGRETEIMEGDTVIVRRQDDAESGDVVVALTGDETRVELPAELTARNLVLVAEDAEGRAEARLEVTPCAFVVQVVRECRQLRVKGKDGKPLVGAYVKVYAKDAAGLEVQFHKDGYTDLRGAFDYASISTDSSFKPAEYAVLVLPDGAGASIQRIPAGQ